MVVITFLLTNCSESDYAKGWKKLGELNLNGNNLMISVPKNDVFKEKLIRFYLASIERNSDDDNFDAFQIAFYNGQLLMLNKENGPGRFEEETYTAIEIMQDEKNYYLEIPNKYLFEEDMNLWSAYENDVFVNNIKLYSKRTGKIDISDPYPYISISK